jgi:signal transduction histidine kinase
VRVLRDAGLATRVGYALAAVSVVAVVIGVVLFVSSGARFGDSFMLQNVALSLALAIAFAAMVRREPHNGAVWTLGWAMAILAFGQVLNNGIIDTTLLQLTGEVRGPLYHVPVTHGELPAWLVWLMLVQEYSWVFAWLSLVTISLLLFPDGRLLSRRWRLAVVAAIAGMVSFTVPFLIAWRPSARADLMVGEYRYTTGLYLADLIGSLLVVAAFVAALVSLAVRHRRASGEGRHQIRWVAMGGTVVMAAHLLWLVAIVDFELAERLARAGVLVSVPVLVASYAVAILRYRLYDIDVVISRSLVVAVLAGFIASVYIAVVVGVGRWVGVGDEASLGLKVVATAIVAVAFQPLRERVRRWADRMVYGHRATPYDVLAGFSRQAAGTGDEASLQRIAEVLAAGTGAQPAAVWLRVGDRLRAVASSANGSVPHGSASELPTLPVDGEVLPALPASLAIPVRHDGELLGAVSLSKPRSEPPTRQDEELAARLARGLALLLRNARLTAELREHLVALQASRSRLVRAQDEARRAIESELRTGAQQQLDALKARLGEVAGDAAAAGAERTAALLEQLEGEADDADDTLRTLAQGIYPPLLEADGLGAAVTAQVARSTLPVTVHATGLPRYPADVEAAAYFCILEALQNATKYAQASSAHVRLEPRDDGLRFEIADDGIGFDPHDTGHGSGLTGIAARLDTLDGSLQIRSRPGTGTRITGHIPAPPHQPTPAKPRAVEVPA